MPKPLDIDKESNVRRRIMALLGEDGRGYELAKRLEGCGVWRSWLGESNYASFAHFLASPSTWEAFMRADDSKTRAQIQLQLRARALLYDKASVSLFLRSHPSSSSSSSSFSSPSPSSSSSSAATATPSKLSPSYLQLHGDDVYFSLEDDSQEGVAQHQEGSAPTNSISSKIQPKLAFSVGSRYDKPEFDNISQRPKHDNLPESWYNQFIEKYRASRQYRLPFADRESQKRTPEGMYAYLKLLEKHKRRRQAFKEDQSMCFGNSIWENGSNMHSISISDGNNLIDDETSFFPETMFPLSCVPDSALPPTNKTKGNQKVEFYGVLDSLPHVVTRSPAMMERFGIRPEYLRTGLGRSKYRGKSGLEGNWKPLGQEQALRMSQQVITRLLTNVGFESTTEVPMEVLSQVLSGHICKLGRVLKVLTDSYRKQCSAIEILKMFLQTAGCGNLGALAEHAKDGTKISSHQTQQHVRGLQSGFQSQHQSPIIQPQQFPRQMSPQMQMVHPQNLTFQQQQHWNRMRRSQPSTPRSGMTMEKDRPMLEVKIENPADSPMDVNTFTAVNGRHHQMQFRQQQMGGMTNQQAQSSHQFKQLASLQIPQHQMQNMVTVRPPPVKVEGFQELMGGDATLKHDSEEHKLTSPSK